MITKSDLQKFKTADSHVKAKVRTPWNKTSLSSIYSAVDRNIEEDLAGICGVVDFYPVSYDAEQQEFVIEVVLDVSDINFEDED